MTASTVQWFDDIEVGDRFESATAYRVTEEEIREFARRYDPHPGHIDPVTAQATVFGGLAASGWHTSAMTMKLFWESGFPVGHSVGADMDLQWPTPTRPGDELTLVLEITDKRESRSKPDRGVVTMQWGTRNQDGEWRQRCRCTVVMFKDPAKAGTPTTPAAPAVPATPATPAQPRRKPAPRG
ncbi:MAG: MaoC family dehydratase [Propionibacteriaceae bacterium]|jgi:acyl dehydratase|nr:MaoC family dehydratase [Propionibacteriaceae bacterium]